MLTNVIPFCEQIPKRNRIVLLWFYPLCPYAGYYRLSFREGDRLGWLILIFTMSTDIGVSFDSG